MTPPCPTFSASVLESKIQVDVNGKRRKGDHIDLSKCELLEMVQYDCQVEHPADPDSRTVCWPVQRLFRRCQDQRGSFLVETTHWERITGDRKVGQGSMAKEPPDNASAWLHSGKAREPRKH